MRSGSLREEPTSSLRINNLNSLGKPIYMLKEFLINEQNTLKAKGASNRESKVEMFTQEISDNTNEISKKQFIIKTKRVNLDGESEEDNSLFIHLFIDTTQITQLEEIKAQNRYQRQMLANVSHEFRTPLNAMMMSLQLLKATISPKDEKFLKIAHSSCNILSALVEDILDHAKIESGVFEIQETEFAVEELIEEVQAIFELQAQRKGITLNFSVNNKLKFIYIKSDKQRLKQILLNLISNAFKFTDSGYIKVDIYPLNHEPKRQYSNSVFDSCADANEPEHSLCYSIADERTDKKTVNRLDGYAFKTFLGLNSRQNPHNTIRYEETKKDLKLIKPMELVYLLIYHLAELG